MWLPGLVLALSVVACGAPATPPDAGASAATRAPAISASPTAAAPTPAPSPTQPPTPGGGDEAAPAITEARFVDIEWPAAIRVGDSDFIRLALVPGPGGALTPTAEVARHQTGGEPIKIPNLYDTHNVLAAAELSGVGFEIDRPGEISQTLVPGGRIQWQWRIAPKTAGSQVVTLTLKLRFVPKSGGETVARSVWARRLTVESRTVLGLSGRATDLLGMVGAVSGGLLGFPFADRLYGWVWRRIFPRRKT